jgi:MFS family permease
MDTLGAAIGPTIALVFLIFYPHQYKTIFLLAFIPGIISVALIFLLRETKAPTSTLGKGNFFSFFKYWNIASRDYKRLVVGLLFFALFNSSDLFLILRTKQVTGSDRITIEAYILYNVVFALASYPLGAIADKIGIKKVFFSGLGLFALVYFLFGITNSTAVIFGAFFIYGIYAAATEGISKAWITNLAHVSDTATSIGFYTSAESICTLFASMIAGAIWDNLGSSFTFLATSVATIIVIGYFIVYLRQRHTS